MHKALLDALARQEATVGVVGLGYVGLPLALHVAHRGFRVLGFDADGEKVSELNVGRSYIASVDGSALARYVAAGRFEATASMGRLGEPDVVVLCVPTPLDAHGAPDLQFVRLSTQAVARTLRPGQLVVLESTTYPGTTSEVVAPILAAKGLRPGLDYFVAYSPERVNPGARPQEMEMIPKVVGAIDEASRLAAVSFYTQIGVPTVPVSSPAVAEACKLTENVFRAVNIALVNELKIIFDRLGIDVHEVLDAAETKPYGFMRFDPGPGWGGHCIPIDPFYLSWKAEREGAKARFIHLAGELNREMPHYVLSVLSRELEERGLARLERARILLLGVAYKADVDDPRESPAFELLELLRNRGAEVGYHDPYIPRLPTMRGWPDLPPLASMPLDREALSEFDAAIVVTRHTGVDYELVRQQLPLIIDCRRAYPASHPNVVRA